MTSSASGVLPPTVFVLFGATGDLAKRLVLPAFAALHTSGLLPDEWVMIGNGRKDQDDAWFQQHVAEALGEEVPGLSSHLLFAGNGFTADDAGDLPATLERAKKVVGDDAEVVHYIALPPSTFIPYTEALEKHGLADGARVVYEKPYGQSPEDFEQLEEVVHRVFDEDRVYRLDHFLGKEATQELHVLRFANTLISNSWSNVSVEQVQIDVPEVLDIDDRAEFYDATGAALDMVVTHLFQVAAEIAMEPPVSMQAGDLLQARESILAAFRPLSPDEVVLGQYDGYQDVQGVAEGSTTDTFIAARLWVDTDRWHGVPFLLRTGKCLAVSEQLVTLILKTPDGPTTHIPPMGNRISFSLKGSGRLDLGVVVKTPGAEVHLSSANATLELASTGDGPELPAYAQLLYAVVRGDRSLFTSSEGLASAWAVIKPLLDNRPAVLPYAVGSWGPEAASELAGPSGWLLAPHD